MKSKVTRQFIITTTILFALLAFILVFIFRTYYVSLSADIRALGVSNTKSQAAMVESYLAKGGDVLWFAAESVDHFLSSQADTEEMRKYLVRMTDEMKQVFDVNFTGIYGYIKGAYLDGAGWEPPEGYEPRSREWYSKALENKGKMVMSAPYLDAQTGKIIVSYSQALSDGVSVLSLDIVLGEVQTITEQMTIGNMGYGFIVDDSGLVISHFNKEEVGKNYSGNTEWSELLSAVHDSKGKDFEMNIGGKSCTVFSEPLDNHWYVVIVVDNSVLYNELRTQIIVGSILLFAAYVVIVVFCVVSVKRITKAERKEQESLARIRRMNINIIRSLASTIDAKDRYTSGHSQRVAEYAVRIAKKMGKSEEDLRVIYYAGILHDVGKIRISELLINKSSGLTDGEFDEMRIHPVSGYQILRNIHEDERIANAAKYHHEHWDGTGYPSGLEGEDIPEIARIIAVADAYDAMSSERSYRALLPQAVVRAEIEAARGSQLDPLIAGIMLEIIDEDKDYELRQKEDKIKNILVVDDDPMIIRDVKKVLKDLEDIKIFSAQTEAEVMEYLEKSDISLILLDLKMPEIDGFTMYQHIRVKYDTPVVLLTGDRSKETIRRMMELKIDDYVTKPLDGHITRETVHGIIHRSSEQFRTDLL